MSKAFAKEDDDREDEPESGSERAAGRASYITVEGHRKLQLELDNLWKVERPRITAEVAEAAAQGDRSENAEYIYGKKRLREIDRRIRFLARRLDNLTVAGGVPADPNRVYFGAWITVEDEDGATHKWRIVGSDEFDVSAGKISFDSPLARAFMGKRVGDGVTVSRPKGDIDYVLLDIGYEG